MVSLGATVVFSDADHGLQLGEDWLRGQPVAPSMPGPPLSMLIKRIWRPMAFRNRRGSPACPMNNKPVQALKRCLWVTMHRSPWRICTRKSNKPIPRLQALDTALSAGVLGLHWLDTGKEVLFERLGLPPEDRISKNTVRIMMPVQAAVSPLLNHPS